MHPLDIMNKSMTKSSIMKISVGAVKAGAKQALRTVRGKARKVVRQVRRTAKPGHYKGKTEAYSRAVERGRGTVMGPDTPIGRRLARLKRGRALSEVGAARVRRARPRILAGGAAGVGYMAGRRRRRKK